MLEVLETIVLGRDDANRLLFTEDGIAIDFSTVPRITFEIVEAGYTFDSNSLESDVTITWADDASPALPAGIIEFRFGNTAEVPPGLYHVRVTYYDVLNDDGIVLAHEDHPTSQVKMRFV